jgi:hypothetical protein
VVVGHDVAVLVDDEAGADAGLPALLGGGICLPKKSLKRSSPKGFILPKGLPAGLAIVAAFSTWMFTTAGPTCSASVLKLSGIMRDADGDFEAPANCWPVASINPAMTSAMRTGWG